MKPKTQKKSSVRAPRRVAALLKAPTGIQGLDELTGGGLPKGRPTLLCGSAGCGEAAKTVEQDQIRGEVVTGDRVQMAHLRQGDGAAARTSRNGAGARN